MPEFPRILFVQTSDVLEPQRETVTRTLREQLGAKVGFASSPADVAPGTSYDVVIAPTVAWLPELLARTDGVRWVHFLSAGVERIWAMDVDWARLTLTTSSGVHAAPMSEYAMGAILHFAKQFDRFVAQSRESRWQRAWLDELTGRTLVILGMGSVGRAVAERAETFGMAVHGVARTPRDGRGTGSVSAIADLQALLPHADYVVVTVPLTAETAGMVGREFFGVLKGGAVLVDMSRGGVVSTDALLVALEDGTLRGAALDVFEEEPLPTDSPLWNRPNVLVTPHVAGTTPHYLERALDTFVQNARRYLADEPLLTPVDVSRGY